MYTLINSALLILRIVANKVNQQIIEHIRGLGEANVTTLYTTLRMEQSVVSQRLKQLRKCGVVNSRKDGKYVLYSLNQGRIDVITCMSKAIVNNERVVSVTTEDLEAEVV